MESQNFDLNKIKTLSPNDAKTYIDTYFIPLDDGTHAFMKDGKYIIYDDSVIKKTYFKRMPKELNKYYFEEKTDLKTIIYDINKPEKFDNFLNLCPKMKHSYTKYEEFDESIKSKVKILLKHIEEVYCSNNNDSYNFTLKWLSNLIKGKRNNSCIYLKASQGVGKSTITEFLREHVIGRDLTHQGGSGPLKTNFNSELSGKILVIFEELENFNASEWMSMSSTLKRQITSPTIMIVKKGVDPKEEMNLNNYIIISNNDAIQDDDGRRYFILDVNPKYLGNVEYFNKLYRCFDDTVGKAFYCYLKEVDTTNFNSQQYPITQSKLDSYSKRLDNAYKFIKDEYILKKANIERKTVQEFYDEYKCYCSKQLFKAKNKIDFKNTLTNVNIQCKKSNGQHIYKVNYDTLKKVSDKFNWVHELDEVIINDNQENKEERDNIIDEFEKQEDNKYKKMYQELLQKQNDEAMKYKKMVDDLIQKYEKKEVKNITEIVEEDEPIKKKVKATIKKNKIIKDKLNDNLNIIKEVKEVIKIEDNEDEQDDKDYLVAHFDF